MRHECRVAIKLLSVYLVTYSPNAKVSSSISPVVLYTTVLLVHGRMAETMIEKLLLMITSILSICADLVVLCWRISHVFSCSALDFSFSSSILLLVHPHICATPFRVKLSVLCLAEEFVACQTATFMPHRHVCPSLHFLYKTSLTFLSVHTALRISHCASFAKQHPHTSFCFLWFVSHILYFATYWPSFVFLCRISGAWTGSGLHICAMQFFSIVIQTLSSNRQSHLSRRAFHIRVTPRHCPSSVVAATSSFPSLCLWPSLASLLLRMVVTTLLPRPLIKSQLTSHMIHRSHASTAHPARYSSATSLLSTQCWPTIL